MLITFLALAGVLTRLPRGDAPTRTGRHGTALDLPGTPLLAAAPLSTRLAARTGTRAAFQAGAALAVSAAPPRKPTPDGRHPTLSPSRLCAVRRTRGDSAQT
ncbi:hypothetical protein ACWGMA_41175 [Streptomyces asiaticus]